MGGKTWKAGFDPWPEARMATAPSGSYHPATLPDVFWPFFSLESRDNDIPYLSWLMYLSMYNVADCH